MTCDYAELDVTSNFSFLRGASHPDELVRRAAELGMRALALTDRNTLAGMVRAHQAAKEVGLTLVVGCRVTVDDCPPLLAWPTDRAAYGRLCRMLTLGKQRVPKGEFQLSLTEFIHHSAGLFVAAAPDPLGAMDELYAIRPVLGALKDALGDRLSLAGSALYGPDNRGHLHHLAELARHTGVPLLASNHVHYHDRSRRPLQDVLTCVRHGCTIDQAGYRLFPNAERHLKSPERMHRLFADYPRALRRTIQVAQACTFRMDRLRYEYPDEICPAGQSPLQYLADLAWRGAAERYPGGAPDNVRRQIEHELKLIEQLRIEAYFLTVYDLVRFARSRGILCQGRGSAANSAVCYCIGVTSVDPARIDLLFERFVSAARDEPPDIDIDFEHERREEVIQYIYSKYGRRRAGMAAEVISYRGRSAVRDVGKALGLSLDSVDRMAKQLDWWHRGTLTGEQVRAIGLDPSDGTIARTIELSGQLLGFPRHLGQHVGGMVMTRGPLCELVPIENAAMENRTVIEWDKDDIDALGILKVDCLGLGMLTCISRAFKMIGDSDEATERRSDEGKQRGGEQGRAFAGADHGTCEGANIPGSGGMAKGNGTGQAGLSRDALDAGGGAIRIDQPNEASGRFHSLEHRRGACAAEPSRLSQVSAHIAGLAGGIDDADDHCVGSESDVLEPIPGRPACRGRSHSSGTDSQPRKTQKLTPSVAASLRRSVACSPLASLPPEDPLVYDMISRADTIGVFQIESRAQMSMLPRLRPRCFYDLVIEVAIVRPGPIQGNMVHPYLRRRNGEEPVSYPSEALRQVLSKTLGVPLFQEQAMRLAMVGAGFSAEEADRLRRAMAAWRKNGALEVFHPKIVQGMLANGYTPEFAEQCFQQIRGFGEYGFPESHAASFALLVYASAWLKRHHPAAFACALINSQPMGFYAPAQIIRDVRAHGVPVRPIDVNHSDWDCTLEAPQSDAPPDLSPDTWGRGGPVLRLGMRLIKGLSRRWADAIAAIRQADGAFTTVEQLQRAAGLPRAVLQRLAEADALASIRPRRRSALWQVLALDDRSAPLFDVAVAPSEPPPALPEMPPAQEVMIDYDTTGLSLKDHPVGLLRRRLAAMHIIPATALAGLVSGRWVKVAGLVLVRQRPGTAGGVVFMTLEDESGVCNLIIRAETYDRYRPAARHAALLRAEGYLQCQGDVRHVIVKRLFDLSHLLPGGLFSSRDFH